MGGKEYNQLRISNYGVTMDGHRVNLTLATGDYQRLLDAAASDGKSPTAFAADVLKAFLLRGFFVGSQEPISQAAKPLLDRSGVDVATLTLPGIPEGDSRPLSRQERRALERGKQKKRE
jgi:hypothetical protein